MFSKACEYAIKATIFTAKQALEGKRTNVKEIAEGIDSPEAFTAKILQILVKHQIILSQKGAGGGFDMQAEKIQNTSLIEIVLAVDGDAIINRCVLGLKQCSGANPCPFHEKYAPVRMKLVASLKETTIADLVAGLTTRMAILKE